MLCLLLWCHLDILDYPEQSTRVSWNHRHNSVSQINWDSSAMPKMVKIMQQRIATSHFCSSCLCWPIILGSSRRSSFHWRERVLRKNTLIFHRKITGKSWGNPGKSWVSEDFPPIRSQLPLHLGYPQVQCLPRGLGRHLRMVYGQSST